MKTQIIRLDASDNLVSTQDKLSWVKMSRVVLVIPEKVTILSRQLDLNRIQRYAIAKGLRLAIVTKHKHLISRCKALGISTFTSTLDAQKNHEWNTPIRYVQRISEKPEARLHSLVEYPNHVTNNINFSQGLRITFLGLIIFTLVFFGLILIPSATIDIQPIIKVQTESISLISGENRGKTKSIFISSEEKTIMVVDSTIIPTSGTLIIANEYATGFVRFENLTENEVRLPAGTIVTSSEAPIQKYATLEDVVIPPGVGENEDIDVRAVNPGSLSNIGKGKVAIIEGIFGSNVSVSNPLEIQGGTEKQVHAATSGDRQIIEQALQLLLSDTCELEITKSIKPEDFFLTGSGTILINQKTFYPEETQPSDYQGLLMEGHCTGRYVKNDIITEVATRLLDERITPGFRPSGEVILTDTSKITKFEESYTWTITVERLIETQIDRDELIQQIVGRNRNKATQIIEASASLSSAPLITISPQWWMNLPLVAWRIDLSIDE